MDVDHYRALAVDKTIQLLREQGLKYRHADFYTAEHCNYNNAYKVADTIIVNVSYQYGGDRGKQLKEKKNQFLNYFNARVLENGIRFRFSFTELEMDEVKESSAETPVQNIIDKISKLLALSTSPNEHEALAASMKAQELLAKYNLNIEAVTGKPKEEEIAKSVADVGVGDKWKYDLADVIARSYCCKTYFVGSCEIYFYGFKSDILIARRVFCYLFDVGKRLGKAYVNNERKNGWSTYGLYNSFCSGFTDGINSQLSMQCKALMLVVPQKVEASYMEFSKNFNHKDLSVSSTDGNAYEEGKIQGKRALNAQYIDRHDTLKYIEN